MYKHFVMVLLLVAIILPSTVGAAAATDSTKIACVKEAVMDREEGITTAVKKFHTTVSGAYEDRADALEAAYAKTDKKEVKKAVGDAWKTFKATMKKARADWKKERNAAWKTFKTEQKACKAPTEVSDATNESADGTTD